MQVEPHLSSANETNDGIRDGLGGFREASDVMTSWIPSHPSSSCRRFHRPSCLFMAPFSSQLHLQLNVIHFIPGNIFLKMISKFFRTHSSFSAHQTFWYSSFILTKKKYHRKIFLAASNSVLSNRQQKYEGKRAFWAHQNYSARTRRNCISRINVWWKSEGRVIANSIASKPAEIFYKFNMEFASRRPYWWGTGRRRSVWIANNSWKLITTGAQLPPFDSCGLLGRQWSYFRVVILIKYSWKGCALLVFSQRTCGCLQLAQKRLWRILCSRSQV